MSCIWQNEVNVDTITFMSTIMPITYQYEQYLTRLHNQYFDLSMDFDFTISPIFVMMNTKRISLTSTLCIRNNAVSVLTLNITLTTVNY